MKKFSIIFSMLIVMFIIVNMLFLVSCGTDNNDREPVVPDVETEIKVPEKEIIEPEETERVPVAPSDPEYDIQPEECHVFAELLNGAGQHMSDEDSQKIYSLMVNMKDETDYVCNCIPQFSLYVNGIEYIYHHNTGVIFDVEEQQTYLVNDKEKFNSILDKYFVMPE